MTRSILLRALVAVAVAGGIHEARAQVLSQCGDQGCQGPVSPNSGPDEVPAGVIGGIIGGIAGLGIVQMIFPDQPPVSPPSSTNPTLPSTCNLPPAVERRYDPTHVIFDIPSTVSTRVLNQIAARHKMTPTDSTNLSLTGRTLHVWRIDDGTSVPDAIRNLCTTEPLIAGAQPNYLYALTQDQQEPVNPTQYAPQKLHLLEAHRLASGNKVLVAIIDSKVDASHPELVGSVGASFEASAEDEPPHSHGTGMAGAIAAHLSMLGVAPHVELLAAHAFSSTATSAEGTTFSILKSLDWAVQQGARVVNMSFAGPPDPRLADALAKANKKGIVLVAAAGNAGPKSPPLYPGAYEGVIAVTATDFDDALFPGANRGKYVAVAAPGVDVFAPGPDKTYQMTTGTSVAAAEVSGVVALLIESNPALTPAEVRKILIDTAKRSPGAKAGYGIVNAFDAATAAKVLGELKRIRPVVR